MVNTDLDDQAELGLLRNLFMTTSTLPAQLTTFNLPKFDNLFEIEEDKIFARNKAIEGKKALIINDNPINIVSNRYHVVQPKEVVENLIDAGVMIDWMKLNPNTGGLMVKSFLETRTIGGESHRLDLAFYTGHDSMHSTALSFQMLRHKCDNQIPVIMGNKENHLMKVKHISTFNYNIMAQRIDEAQTALELFIEQYEGLKDIQLNKAQFLEFYRAFTRSNGKAMERMADIYSHAKGQDIPESAYKGLQAVTYNLSHNGRKTKKELETKNIKNMDFASKFMEGLLELA